MSSPNPIRDIEKRGEMVQLGVAAGSAAGLLALLAVSSSDDLLWWAGVCFCVALPPSLGRAMMTFTAEVCVRHESVSPRLNRKRSLAFEAADGSDSSELDEAS